MGSSPTRVSKRSLAVGRWTLPARVWSTRSVASRRCGVRVCLRILASHHQHHCTLPPLPPPYTHSLSSSPYAILGICALGPRAGVTFTARFPYRKAAPPPQSTEFQCLGVMLLWFSWFGFNGCSAMFIHGDSVEAAARSMVMTALAGVTGAVTSIAISGFVLGADQVRAAPLPSSLPPLPFRFPPHTS